ncbi:PREDICTED: probable splicing factor, arginine/serine-rich 7 [Camelina sativa]|uniref:Probable splicing factor, arginine/serine-rich 7 n=1 Tax=Camelina sativa TaxID=90675 RepID=A0ABM0ZFS3_CAMSA|nr:PREDICTED: probable splicing factor, arginine/serine-rich 7 [Camelina sativa]
MEEEKAAAYYDELTRKGEGAARFKQGLGFSSGANAAPERGSAIASSSSFLNQFVKASSNPTKSTDNKDSEIRSIREKLKKDQQHLRVPERSSRESSERRRNRSRERDERDKSHTRRRSRSRSSERRSRYADRERRRSRSRSSERRNRYGDRDSRRRRRSRSRSSSPRRESRRREDVKEKKIDYSRLIKGYDDMSAAEKVKAKMKLQLDETAEKDTSKGAGWERFEFDKDAPVDDEEVEECTDDDAALVKRMGQSFRFSAIEAKREEQLKAAHDEAMFGASTFQTHTDNAECDVTENTNVKDDEGESNSGTISLLSEKVLAKQQGSWRDRARKS